MAINLQSIAKTGASKPPRVLIYGVHGIGKSTFASQAKNPIFIRTEDGLAGIEADAFPVAKSFNDVMEALNVLRNDEHKFKTVVLDSVDWLENLVWSHTAQLHGKDNIEDFGYGKGFVIAMDYWRMITTALDELRDIRNMTNIVVAHCEVKRFDSPDSEPFDRYQPKMHKLSAAWFQEWTDVLGFANYKVHTKESDAGYGKKRTRAIGSGERLLYTTERPSHIAKCRYKNIPEVMPLDWPTLANSIAASFDAGEETKTQTQTKK